MQRRLDEHPEKMRQRRETVEHPFGTIKARMGATHSLMKTLPRVATEMACQSALEWDPLSASKRDPFERRVLPVALAPSELAGVAETARARTCA